MQPNSLNTSELATFPHRRKAVGVWWRVVPIAMIVIGATVISYPLWPGIKFALTKPKPVIPFHTKLVSTPSAFAALPSLPVITELATPKDNRLVIPSIGVNMPILEGPTQKTLDRGGIWHIPKTSDPVKGGNIVLSGHRWQYLPPSSTTLYLLDKVKIGEPVLVYWKGQEYDYTIDGRQVVNPDRVDILKDTPQPKLTIFTCTPLYSTKQRLVLFGHLIS